MNRPIEPDGNLEQRVEQIEREMKRARFALDHIKLDTGATKESLDTIERHLSETNKLLRGITQTQVDHGERFDTVKVELKQELEAHSDAWLKSLQQNFEQVKEALVEIRTTQGSRNERFDHIETTMATKDDTGRIETTLAEILDRLPPKQP